MEARIIAIERQLQSLSQIQKLILTALSDAISSSVPIKSDVKKPLSEWAGQTTELQSSLESFEKVREDPVKSEDAAGGLEEEKMQFIDSGVATSEEERPPTVQRLEQLASDILDIIQRFGKHLHSQGEGETQPEWIGKPLFMDKVLKQLEQGQAIKMILPAFPWKSMCESIRAVYPLGGEVHIATDGLVFIRFLESDLKYSEVAKTATSGQKFRKCVKKVAINMMIRAESFTKLLQSKCPDYVRLSIHPSTGAVKLSVPLIVTGSGEFPRAPWHSSVALALDGSYSTVHSKDVRETHSLILRADEENTPYYFREKSELWDWADTDVVFAPHYPNTLAVRPRRTVEPGTKSLTTEQIEKLKALISVHSAGPVVIEGFANGDAVAETAVAAAAAATAA
ncbi:Pyoverdine/dityrosine biosynthesis protein-domain-containing protein [Pyrenochaeta sp. MPI-SDFR-AT-0127]|nr:Pyoverdine/dityrosine biosynthesis protein-domain-containing protein [Pyrenochaeta sp. MPI-SDFR-AT-0127]